MRSSLCEIPRYCAPYDHKHCCICDVVIDHHHEDFGMCACGDDLFIMCPSCAVKNPRCNECEVAA